MTILEKQINLIAQNKTEFDKGQELILKSSEFDFNETFEILKNYIFNSIPNKSDYNSDSYQKAIVSRKQWLSIQEIPNPSLQGMSCKIPLYQQERR